MRKKKKRIRRPVSGTKAAWAAIERIQKKAIRDIKKIGQEQKTVMKANRYLDSKDPFSPEAIARAAGKPNPGRHKPRATHYTPGYD